MELMEQPIIETYIQVKFPSMRKRIIVNLQELADRSYQLEEWVSLSRNDAFWYNLEYCLEAFEDTFDLDITVEEQIEYVLAAQDEADVIKVVMKALDIVRKKIGSKQPDSAYINSPLWDDVVSAAKAAFEVFMANEEKARQINPHPWNGEDDWPNVKPEDNVKLE